MRILEGLYYTEDHEWVRIEEDKAYIGVTDYAQEQIGNIVYVELSAVDDEYQKGETFGVIESVKAASDVYMPIDGLVIEVNEDLEDQPQLINDDPYDNWIICITNIDEAQLDDLLSSEQYKDFIGKEDYKLK